MNEIALAGKGFSPEIELEYRKNGLDYSSVDMMEILNIDDNDLRKFIDDGRLISSVQSAYYPFFNMGWISNETNKTPTPEDEYYLGRAVAANILTTYRPYTQNTELSLYLNRICQTLVVNSSRPVIYDGYHLLILDNPGYNAFASPGGHVFVTRGLVEAAPSEDALAGIIAHELAHIMLRHSTSIIDDMKINEEINSMATKAVAAAGERNTGAQRAMAFRNSVNEYFEKMMKSGYSQPQEFEADKYATALLAISGYDPGGLLGMLKVLQKVQISQRDSFISTHPSMSERIANLENEILLYRFTDTRSLRYSRYNSYNPQ
jgi:predicted Zn-dependent protease